MSDSPAPANSVQDPTGREVVEVRRDPEAADVLADAAVDTRVEIPESAAEVEEAAHDLAREHRDALVRAETAGE